LAFAHFTSGAGAPEEVGPAPGSETKRLDESRQINNLKPTIARGRASFLFEESRRPDPRREVSMTKTQLAGLVPAVTFCLAALAVAASPRQSVTVELLEATALNGTQLSAGTYTFSWTGEGPEVAVTIKKSGKVVAETRGQLVDTGHKANVDAVVVRTNGGGAKTLTKVQFEGRKSALVFSGS
jgi:hypothetical protein